MNKRKYKISLEILAAAAALAAMLWAFSSLQEIFLRYVGFLSGFFRIHEILGIFIFLSVSTAAAIISPFSSLPLIPSMIEVWGNLFTFFLLMAGWFLGGWLGYIIGERAGRKIIERWWSLERIEYYKNKLPPQAQFWLVVLFRAAIPSEITGITLGIIRYDLLKYLIAVFLTEIPFAFAAVYLGGTFAEGRFLAFGALVVLAAALVALASWAFHRKI